MRIIITGSRSLNPHAHGLTQAKSAQLSLMVKEAIWRGIKTLIPSFGWARSTLVLSNVEFVVGTAAGPDTVGEIYGKELGAAVTRMPADWSLGRGAGYKRNRAMADYAVSGPGGADDAGLIAVWDGVSKGTKHMVETARLVGMKDEHVVVVRVEAGRLMGVTG